jgi:Tfp pilus assembly protein PilF
MSVTGERSFQWRRSRRTRRIAWTGSTLLALVLSGTLVSWRIHKEHTPDEYTPGEESKDITSATDERAATVAIHAPRPAPKSFSSRVVDRLLDPGRALPAGAPEPRFTDVTRSAGLASFRQFQGERSSQLPEDMGSGAAWGDFDNDGLDDLFVVSGGGSLELPERQRAPSVLYRNVGNGRFEKVQDFPDLRIVGMGAAWGDYDNDGWLDLVVTGYDTIVLFHNDHGHLVRVKSFPSPKGFWTGVSWGDYNRDGYLDLYVCGYVKYKPGERNASSNSTQFGLEVPFTLNPASYEPERNLLLRNNGDGTFTEVAAQLGVANPEGRSLSALWHDFDGDGWLDLYVANDISENKLYLNRHGKFVDAGRAAWVEEYRGSMGLAAGDFDRDGDDDLFISHWIAQGFALYQSLLTEQKGTGATGLHFTDVAATAGIGQHSLQSIGWGTSFVDIDSDGWPDLIVANGSTFEQKDSSPRRLVPMPSFLFWNAHGDFFHDLGPWNRSFAEPHVSRGLAVADFDNDGAMDVAVVDQGEGVRLLRNDIPQGNWAEFRLHNRVPPRGMPLGFGDGSLVTAWVDGVPLRQTVGSSSYLSQDSHRLHIGLGSATQIDRLEVSWLRGPKEVWTKLPANHIWDITQGEAQAKTFTPGAGETDVPSSSAELTPTMLTAFWDKQHAAMDAMKREHDYGKAIVLFRQALSINPSHEDSHYYLANCLAASGDISAALAELDRLARINPQNHRAFQRKGELMAASADSRRQLEAAREPLKAALRLNSEETGTLLLLAEVELTLGNFAAAQKHLAHVCQANPRAANAWFLRGYIAWKQHEKYETLAMLEATRTARGRDWKPAGSAAEGDVNGRMFRESGFLNVFEERWNGSMQSDNIYVPLDSYVRPFRR